MRYPSFFGLSALALSLCAHAAYAQSGYTITDLGSLGGDSYAYGINNSGQVTGVYYTATAYHAFLYSNGAMRDIGNPGDNQNPVSTIAAAYAINDSGQVVGKYSYTTRDASGQQQTTSGGFLYQNGVFQDIGLNSPQAINNAGQIVGQDINDTAALYQNGAVTELKMKTNYSTANAINRYGVIAGTDGIYAFSYQNGVEQILPTLDAVGGKGAVGNGINDSGQVVGFSGANDNHGHATLWQNGIPQDIGPSGVNSQALAINNHGQSVGFYYLPNFDTEPLLYQNGQTVDLLAGTIWHNGEATGINDSGQIVGWATLPNGATHAFLATPNAVPEPGSLMTLGAGIGAALLAAQRRKRRVSA